MNETLFFVQIFLILGFAWGAFKWGKEALIGWVAIQALLANLFVLKQITLFGFEVTASDAFAIGSLLGLNLLQEYFSPKEAQQATWISFFFMVFFVIVSQIHLLFHPSPHDFSQKAYALLLTPAPRLLIASLGVFFLVQQFDIWCFGLIKKRLPKQGLPLRSALTLTLSQFLDTTLFSLIGLYGIVASIVDIILLSFIVKLIVIFCFTSFIKWVRA